MKNNKRFFEDLVWEFDLLQKEWNKKIIDFKNVNKDLFHQFQLEMEMSNENKKLSKYKDWIKEKLKYYGQIELLIANFEEKKPHGIKNAIYNGRITHEFLIWKKTEEFMIESKLEYKTLPGKPKEHINRVFTKKIKDYLIKLRNHVDNYIVGKLNVANLFEKFISFKPTTIKLGLAALFRLPKTTFLTYRSKSCKKTIIPERRLESMKSGLKKSIKKIYRENHDLVKDKVKLKTILSQIELGLLEIIDWYKKKYTKFMKPTSYSQMQLYHPNFKMDYFSKISQAEQSYWLGFLYADGYITTNEGYYLIGLNQKNKDRERIEKFCETIGINLRNIRSHKDQGLNYISFKVGKMGRKEPNMAKDLKKLGIEYEYNNIIGKRVKKPNMTKFIEAIKSRPNYDELLATFVLGFYDGDGHLHTKRYPILTSAQRWFLEDLKSYTGITNKVGSKKCKKEYWLTINSEFAEKMFKTSINSMKRKIPDKFKKRKKQY